MIVEILLVFVLVALLLISTRRPKNFPPGPRGLPFLGYSFFANRLDAKYSYKGLKKLADKYGPVTGFYHGMSQPVISVCGYKAVKEALLNDELSGRYAPPAEGEAIFGQKLGIVLNDGESWLEQRKYSFRHMRELGFGRTAGEKSILLEVYDLLDHIKAMTNQDRIVDFKGIFQIPALNAFWSTLGGKRYKYDDPEVLEVASAVYWFFRTGDYLEGNLGVLSDKLNSLFPVKKNSAGVPFDILRPVQQFVRAAVEDHKKHPSVGEPRDFIDVYMNEIAKRNISEVSASSFHENQLICILDDMLIGGIESTHHTIGFAVLYLTRHPHAQLKMQQELDAVCGSSLPTLAHRASLPYTEAAIMEVQRLINADPFTVPHRAMKPTHLQGYFIPKDSFVSINLYSVHLDETYWNEPEVFRPERHLDAEGKLVKSDHFLIYGAGKRVCMGEVLARNTLYLFIAGLLKTFHFEPVPNRPLPTLEPNYGISNGYKGFEALVSIRG